jgi:hypothetical protein
MENQFWKICFEKSSFGNVPVLRKEVERKNLTIEKMFHSSLEIWKNLPLSFIFFKTQYYFVSKIISFQSLLSFVVKRIIGPFPYSSFSKQDKVTSTFFLLFSRKLLLHFYFRSSHKVTFTFIRRNLSDLLADVSQLSLLSPLSPKSAVSFIFKTFTIIDKLFSNRYIRKLFVTSFRDWRNWIDWSKFLLHRTYIFFRTSRLFVKFLQSSIQMKIFQKFSNFYLPSITTENVRPLN